MFDLGDAFEHFHASQIVKSAYLVVRAPLAPVFRRVFKQLVNMRHGFIVHFIDFTLGIYKSARLPLVGAASPSAGLRIYQARADVVSLCQTINEALVAQGRVHISGVGSR